MIVELASQVFRNLISLTIRAYMSTSEVKNATAHDTADFINYMNNLFNYLNNRNLLVC